MDRSKPLSFQLRTAYYDQEPDPELIPSFRAYIIGQFPSEAGEVQDASS